MAIAGRWEISSYSSLRESMRAGGAAKDTCSARSWLRSKRPVTREQRFVYVLTQAASWRCARTDISLRGMRVTGARAQVDSLACCTSTFMLSVQNAGSVQRLDFLATIAFWHTAIADCQRDKQNKSFHGSKHRFVIRRGYPFVRPDQSRVTRCGFGKQANGDKPLDCVRKRRDLVPCRIAAQCGRYGSVALQSVR